MENWIGRVGGCGRPFVVVVGLVSTLTVTVCGWSVQVLVGGGVRLRMLHDLCAGLSGESGSPAFTWSAWIGSSGVGGSPHIQHWVALVRMMAAICRY